MMIKNGKLQKNEAKKIEYKIIKINVENQYNNIKIMKVK